MKTTAAASRPKCHFVSNTHWDREWRYSMQRTRHMLVYMMDMLLDMFEKDPEFKSFHLDSQTVPLEDYLEIRPEKEPILRKLVQENRLLVGPWFVLPDEFCVGGESLVRNLLLGHRIARSFGQVTKTGYSPFGWGQISQLPQIYAGFGIPMAAFYRGINTFKAPQSEFIWEGPDGTEVVGSRLAQRPRYNVWYILQRPVYWGMADENERQVAWGAGHGSFRMADTDFATLDARYAHPAFGYHAENVAARAKQTLKEQDDEWTTPHRFWSCGHDSSCPDIREIQMIRDCAEALKDRADVFHSTLADFQQGVVENVAEDLPRVVGEMRHFYTEGSSSALFGWITSARMDVKKDNYLTERLLSSYAEPLAVFSSLLGSDYPRSYIDRAYHWLLQNHGHDSIGACSRDIVPEDMFFRSRQSREISTCVMEQGLMEVAGAIDLSTEPADGVALVVYNPNPFRRNDVVPVQVDIPCEWDAASFEIVDPDEEPVRVQRLEERPTYTIVQSPNDCANMFKVTRHALRLELNDVPGMGYRTFMVRPVAEAAQRKKLSQRTGPHAMENEHLAVQINANGTYDVTHKATGEIYRSLGYFRDASEIGNPWERHQVPNDEVLTTLAETTRIALVRDGELETTFRVEINWKLPACRAENERSRSEVQVPYRIVNRLTLRKGQPWVECETTIHNTAEDHYLQVSFPTGVKADQVRAQTPFDVVTREIERPDPALFAEAPQTEHPMDRFVDISDGQRGVALLNEGLKAYEADEDGARTLSLTMLRCFPLRICVTNLEMTDYSGQDKGSQCLGTHVFRYGFMPHRGAWQEAGAWQASEAFNHMFRVAQIAPTAHGTQPLERSFLEVDPPAVHVSAVKQSEDGKGWVVRLFNPLGETVRGRIRLNGGRGIAPGAGSPVERLQQSFRLNGSRDQAWSVVRRVTLEEAHEEDLAVDHDGWVPVELGRKQIVTVAFMP